MFEEKEHMNINCFSISVLAAEFAETRKLTFWCLKDVGLSVLSYIITSSRTVAVQEFLTAFGIKFLQLRAYSLKVEHRTLIPDVLVRFQLRLFKIIGNVKKGEF